MKIISTSDWHLGNLFHGNDRLPEHQHFLSWLLTQIKEQQPDALLVAGDVFDNGNPSAAAQSAYYEFLADATLCCPTMQLIITAGNHDSASRLEAPRPLLSRYKVEIRGQVQRSWKREGEQDGWMNHYEDLMIPVSNRQGEKVLVLAVPYLRADKVQPGNYSKGVNRFLRELTAMAREKYPDMPLLMMAHMYAQGAEIAAQDASEKIVIGGQEEVNLEGWTEHPDYLTCGHIHKRQPIWHTDWARYTGSVLPMSFAEIDYQHGVDLITIQPDGAAKVDFLEYIPQHPLCILPAHEEGCSPKELKKRIRQELPDRPEHGQLSEHFRYVALKVKLEKVDHEMLKELEDLVNQKDAVLCKIQKVMPHLNLTTLYAQQSLTSLDDILHRNPMDTIREAFILKHNRDMNEQQEARLQELLQSIQHEFND